MPYLVAANMVAYTEWDKGLSFLTVTVLAQGLASKKGRKDREFEIIYCELTYVATQGNLGSTPYSHYVPARTAVLAHRGKQSVPGRGMAQFISSIELSEVLCVIIYSHFDSRNNTSMFSSLLRTD